MLLCGRREVRCTAVRWCYRPTSFHCSTLFAPTPSHHRSAKSSFLFPNCWAATAAVWQQQVSTPCTYSHAKNELINPNSMAAGARFIPKYFVARVANALESAARTAADAGQTSFLERFQDAYKQKLTTVMAITGAAMAPALNPGEFCCCGCCGCNTTARCCVFV